MVFNIYILFIFISSIICTPPPIPQPMYEIYAIGPSFKKRKNHNSSNFKNLEENMESINSTNVIITILKNGCIEEHEINLTNKNTFSNSNEYSFYLSFSKDQSLELISNECYKLNSTENQSINDECTPSFEKNGNNYKFSYNFNLSKDEFIIINYKFKIIQKIEEILYRQQSVSIPSIYYGGFCNYKFIIPEEYISLGLDNNLLEKESDSIYYYNNNCPSYQIRDVINLAPKEALWKAHWSSYVKSTTKLSKASFHIPRIYRGGKNIIKKYKITSSHDRQILNEANLVQSQIYLNVELPGNKKKLVGFDLNIVFGNKLDEDFNVFTSEKFYELNKNVDNKIKNKAFEIINDQNSEYKDYPDYYKIGKFVNSYMTYDYSYSGRELTALQIFNGRRGVCEHFTILYNAMLNAIGIKTIYIVGWAFQKDETSADMDHDSLHAWTAALINGKFKELDATWGLFEGIPAGHIFITFKQMIYYYNAEISGFSFSTTMTGIDKHTIRLIHSLDEGQDEFYSSSKDLKIVKLIYIIYLFFILL